ncbi:DUF1097 domain-containing protein [Elizabethkingia anophelis]|uniref:DUF1097 domain-containing protein n=1 Tax=Elizabethkingia anophelis TaxID=1117645 RepID=UPI00378702C7
MKTLPIACVFGLFSAIAVSLSFAFHWPTWVMFIAWVSFYIFGRTMQSSIWAFLQIVLGMCMAVSIQLTATAFTQIIGSLGFAVSVFLYIGALPYVIRIKKLNNLPAWFLGLIILFGVHPPLEPLPIVSLFLPIAAGFVFALLNYTTVEKIQARQKAQTETN